MSCKKSPRIFPPCEMQHSGHDFQGDLSGGLGLELLNHGAGTILFFEPAAKTKTIFFVNNLSLLTLFQPAGHGFSVWDNTYGKYSHEESTLYPDLSPARTKPLWISA